MTLLDDIAGAPAEALLGSDAVDGFRGFVHEYWADTADDDLAAHAPDNLAAAAASQWRAARRRRAGSPIVRVFDPDPRTHGWRSDRSVAEIVVDDDPFLVSSATLAVTRLGHPLDLVVHPVVAVCRDADGIATAVRPVDDDHEGEGWVKSRSSTWSSTATSTPNDSASCATSSTASSPTCRPRWPTGRPCSRRGPR